MVHEAFISYLWQFQYFDKRDLRTTTGEKIEIFNPGILNTHAGPDFSNAKVRIDGIDWAGSIEIHTRASCWMEHRHNLDPAYENVVLHVVWQNDNPIYRADKTVLPALQLNERVEESLIEEYKKLVSTPSSIPCRNAFSNVDSLIKRSMIDRALTERLEMKALKVKTFLEQNLGDWQETAFLFLARNFGFNVNSEPFLQMAKSLPCRILLKHADKPIQVEALLFGQSGFLEITEGDDYYQLLRREYTVLSRKYNLVADRLKRSQWRFLRLRPANFPTVRIAQFSALLVSQQDVFSKIFQAEDFDSLKRLFTVRQSAYWRHHYRFNRESKQTVAELGDASIENILINSVAPLLVAYGKYMDEQVVVDRAVDILLRIPAESNAILRTWSLLGCKAHSAFDSQGLIELFNGYCQRRNCLNCHIGAALLKPGH